MKIKRKSSDFLQRTHGQGGTRNTINGVGKLLIGVECRAVELPGKAVVSHFAAADFTVFEYFQALHLIIFNHYTHGNGQLFTNFFENPGGAATGPVIAGAQTGIAAENLGRAGFLFTR